jgi:hypothetical protein
MHFNYSNNLNQWVFDRAIYTAQDLPQSYNYARKTSQVIYIRSSTLPSGVYALTGTFNAVTYEGAPSEVGLPGYDRILRVTANPADKIGNVLVGSGIAVLTLPASYDIDYIRLSDPSPTTGPGGFCNIHDSQQNLVYYWTEGGPLDQTVTTWTNIGTTNFDANIAAFADLTVLMTYTTTTTPTAAVTSDIQFRISVLDLTGTPFDTIAFGDFTHVIPVGAPLTTTASLTITGALPSPGGPLTRAISGVLLQYNVITAAAGFTIQANLQTVLTAFAAATPGVIYPVSIVAYEGVAAGTVISLSGVANYELVPNPALAQNVQTYYADRDPHGMELVKGVFSRRDALGIRSVWRIEDYKAAKMYFEELSDFNIARTKYHIEAFDWGGLLKTGLKFLPGIASSVGDAIIPGSGNVIRGIADSLGGLFSASGEPIMYTASGQPVAASGRPVMYTVAPNTGVLMDAKTKPKTRKQIKAASELPTPPGTDDPDYHSKVRKYEDALTDERIAALLSNDRFRDAIHQVYPNARGLRAITGS